MRKEGKERKVLENIVKRSVLSNEICTERKEIKKGRRGGLEEMCINLYKRE